MAVSARSVTSKLALVAVGGLAATVLIPSAAGAAGHGFVGLIGNGIKVHVTKQHQLSTATQPSLEPRPYAGFGGLNNNGNDRFVIAGPTKHTIALSSLTVAAVGGNVGIRIRAVEPTDGSCAAGHTVIVRDEDMAFVAHDGDSHSVAFPSPLIAAPQKGHQICLIAHADTTFVPVSGAVAEVSASGYLR
jgi:hypothetical protein